MQRIRRALCWAFGHTGDGQDSGYHVCSRCGAHAYWDWKDNNPDCQVEYGDAGHLLRPIWAVLDWFAQRRRRPDDLDIPF